MPVTAADIAASDQIAAENAAKEKRDNAGVVPRRRKGKTVAVYVCPTEGCPDYYGAAGMPDLVQSWNHRSDLTHKVGDDPSGNPESMRTHTRSECPTCRAAGKKVDRVRVELFVPSEALTVADAA
jgi:hypothetical protein